MYISTTQWPAHCSHTQCHGIEFQHSQMPRECITLTSVYQPHPDAVAASWGPFQHPALGKWFGMRAMVGRTCRWICSGFHPSRDWADLVFFPPVNHCQHTNLVWLWLWRHRVSFSMNLGFWLLRECQSCSRYDACLSIQSCGHENGVMSSRRHPLTLTAVEMRANPFKGLFPSLRSTEYSMGLNHRKPSLWVRVKLGPFIAFPGSKCLKYLMFEMAMMLLNDS